MKNETSPNPSTAILLLTLACLALAPAALAQTPGGSVATLSASWPCYLKLQGSWYDCPTRVVAGKYVLGEALRQPTLGAQTDFVVSRADRLFVDGVARCEECQRLLQEEQLGLARWDGSRWTAIPLGSANRIISCTGWAERCSSRGGQAWIDVPPGRYRLWAQSGFSTGGGGEIYNRTELELAVHLASGGAGASSQPSPFADASSAAQVEWVECTRSSPFSTGIGETVECQGQGLWRIDGRGSRLGRLAAGDRFELGERVGTDDGALARIGLLGDSQAELVLQGGAEMLIERTGPEETGVALIRGRVLAVSPSQETGGSFHVRTAGAIVSGAGATSETAWDAESGMTEVLAAEGTVELACGSRPEAKRPVYAGERARLEGDCAARFEDAPREELDRLSELASHQSRQHGAGPFGGQPDVAGGYIGCFKDAGEAQGTGGHDLDGELLWLQGLTPQLCVSECATRGYAYAGVQWGRACYCGSGYGRLGESSECTTPCWGDGDQICGGYNANSVYATRQEDGFTSPFQGGDTQPPREELPVLPVGTVVIYRDAGFQGRGVAFNRSVPRLGDTPVGNDTASAVRVASNCRATLYEHSDYRGRAVQVVGDLPELHGSPLGNDQASSVRLECR